MNPSGQRSSARYSRHVIGAEPVLTHPNCTTHTRRAWQAFQSQRASDVLGLSAQERFDGISDAGWIHDVGKMVLTRHRVLGHVGQSLPEVP